MYSTTHSVLPAPALSIVIPAFNESLRIRKSLATLQGFLRFWTGSYEVIIVVEKSTDGTADIARELVGGVPGFTVIANEVQRGKGYAVKTGMRAARGDIRIFMDLDLSTDLLEIPRFIDYFKEHPDVDVLIGSRRDENSQIVKRQNIFRQTMGRTFNKVVQLLCGNGIRDTQCGFKAFRARAADAIFAYQSIDGFAFDVELLLLADGMGFKTQPLPVKWENDALSKVRIVRDSLAMLVEMVRIRFQIQRQLKQYRAKLPVSEDSTDQSRAA